jgi:thiol-disulfide isomerase/thioredoxin
MTIVFNNCLIQKEQNYLLYFYSSYCGHCKEIKDSVIEFALRKIVPFYFVIFDSTVPIFNDIEATIGASKIEEIGILGTPSLINIFEGSVRLNIAGSSKIMELINSYLYK